MKKHKLIKYILIGIAGVIIPCIFIIVISMVQYGSNYPMVKFYYWKGFVEQRVGNNNDAIKNYDKATELDDHYPTAYISRGSAYMDLKKYDKAIENYSMAIKLSPNNEEPYAYRGRAYYEIDSVKNSLEDYNKAIQLNKNFGYAYSNRSLLKHAKLNDIIGACEDLKIASKLGDKDAQYHLKNGVCD